MQRYTACLGKIIISLFQLQLELSEARIENEQLLQKIMFFEDEKKKQFQQKIEMANEIQELMESNHKL